MGNDHVMKTIQVFLTKTTKFNGCTSKTLHCVNRSRFNDLHNAIKSKERYLLSGFKAAYETAFTGFEPGDSSR